VTFSTAVGIGGVAEETEKVTLSRIVPAVFLPTGIAPPDGSIIAAPSFDVTVTANTNLKWWVEVDGAKNYTIDPDNYKTGDTRKVTVAARPAGEAASWTGPTTVTVNAGYDNQTSITDGGTKKTYTYTRSAYTFTDLSVDKTWNSVTIKFTTDAGSCPIRLYVGTNPLGAARSVTSNTAEMFTLSPVATARIVKIVNNVSGEVVGEFEQPAEPQLRLIGPMEMGGLFAGYPSCPGGYYLYTDPQVSEGILLENGGEIASLNMDALGPRSDSGARTWRYVQIKNSSIWGASTAQAVNTLSYGYMICKKQ
jgi:hypothetical protein